MVRELEIDPAWCQTGFWIGEEVLEEGRFIASAALRAMCSLAPSMARFFCELCDSKPRSRTGLLPSSPLRTVHESFPSHSSSPSNASFGETRFRDRKALAVNPVMALRMK
jgi:hypothetical protein